MERACMCMPMPMLMPTYAYAGESMGACDMDNKSGTYYVLMCILYMSRCAS